MQYSYALRWLLGLRSLVEQGKAELNAARAGLHLAQLAA